MNPHEGKIDDVSDSGSTRLLAAGMILFLLGLFAGFAVPAFHNPRLGLSAHLEGVLNGTFLLVVGLAWHRVALGPGAKTAAFWLLLWGAFINFAACVAGAITGASRMTPIAGEGFSALPWQEALVGGMFATVGISMVIAVALLCKGLLR